MDTVPACEPPIAAGVVPFDADTTRVRDAQVDLRFDMSLLGRFSVERRGHGAILRSTDAGSIEPGQAKQAPRVARVTTPLPRHAVPPLDRLLVTKVSREKTPPASQCQVALYSISLPEESAQLVGRGHDPNLRRPFVKSRRPLLIPINPVSVSIEVGEIQTRGFKTALNRALQPVDRLLRFSLNRLSTH